VPLLYVLRFGERNLQLRRDNVRRHAPNDGERHAVPVFHFGVALKEVLEHLAHLLRIEARNRLW
jgi:hypothetical protein